MAESSTAEGRLKLWNHVMENLDSRLKTESSDKVQPLLGSSLSHETCKACSTSPAAPGTCEWLFDRPDYQHFLTSPGSALLLVTAEPGLGKTVLARSIIDREQANESRVTTCHFSFSKRDDEKDQLSTALKAVLHQLSSSLPNIVSLFVANKQRQHDDASGDAALLWRTLCSANENAQQPMLLVLDGLDECDIEGQKLLWRLMHKLQRERRSKLKILVTQRPGAELDDRCKKLETQVFRIEATGPLLRDAAFLAGKLLKEVADASAKTHNGYEGSQERTHLWVYLARALSDISTDVPINVDEAYRRALDSITAERAAVQKLLQILVAARRTLTIEETGAILGLSLIQDPKCVQAARWEEASLRKLVHDLSPLLRISGSRVHFVHESAVDFLLNTEAARSWRVDQKGANEAMTLACVKSLLLPETDANDLRLATSGVLFDYASQHLGQHARDTGSDLSADAAGLLELYNEDREIFLTWTSQFWKHQPHAPGGYGGLHMAAYQGLGSVVETLLEREDTDAEISCSSGDTALTLASQCGHLDVVGLLCKQGVTIDAKGGAVGSPLQAAAAGGFTAVVRLLLDHGAQVDGVDDAKGMPLYMAVLNDHENVVDLLLEAGANANIGGIHPPHLARTAIKDLKESAFNLAVSRNDGSTVKKMLKHGADVNDDNGPYGPPLQRAASMGFLNMVNTLLDAGADVDGRKSSNGPPLYEAIWGRHINVVQSLLEQGADVNITKPGEDSPWGMLHCAFERKSRRIVEMLLAHSTSDFARGPSFGIAVVLAAATGKADSLLVLLEERVEEIFEGGWHHAALREAARAGNMDLCEMLLDLDADINSDGLDSQVSSSAAMEPALVEAARKGHHDIVRMMLSRPHAWHYQHVADRALIAAASEAHLQTAQILLERTADPNGLSQGASYTPLGVICTETWKQSHSSLATWVEEDYNERDQPEPRIQDLEAVAACILDNGADAHGEIWFDGLPLQAAAFRGLEGIVRLLLSHGADVNAVKGHHGSALNAAVKGEHYEVVKILLNAGAEVNAQPLIPSVYHLPPVPGAAIITAAARDNVKILQTLIDHGADVNIKGSCHTTVRNSEYTDALTAATVEGHTDTIKILLTNAAGKNLSPEDWLNNFEIACMSGRVDIASVLLDAHSESPTRQQLAQHALPGSCRYGHIEIVQLLLESDIDLDVGNEHFRAPITEATAEGQAEIVRLLLTKGANPDTGDKDQRATPLCEAALKNHAEIAALFLDHGASVHARHPLHGDVLQCAAVGGSSQTIEMLLGRAVSILGTGGEYGSALKAAAYKGHADVVLALLKAGADPDADGGTAGTALHGAVKGGNLVVAKVLLDAGADVDAVGEGGSALMVAVAKGDESMARLLVGRGADVEFDCGSKGSPLLVAMHREDEAMVRLLSRWQDLQAGMKESRS
ncbi:hypothetical protein CAC42_1506 [Sphaceloma murrayae]|uniref:Nephrocystin 3-like N-terminal domain-containing protein n=1 Tax=Sphaceloma murrayae TaxID=2082308 RepID=A0A2K1R2Y9_9PEZI|nr:hypothetical protein CAC42_1506 [Sphaceloma murrayae]